jgi:uncharacterized protein YjbI with pentapeptide repeats
MGIIVSNIREKFIQHPWFSFGLVLGFVLVIVLLCQHFIFGMTSWADWTGFGEYYPKIAPNGEVVERGKTLWDWFELLIVPAVLGLGAIAFNNAQKSIEMKIASEKNKEDILHSYFSIIGDLILKEDLLAKKDVPDHPVVQVARVRTTTVLRSLDTERQNQVFRFLMDTGLSSFILIHSSLYNIDFHNIYIDTNVVDFLDRDADIDQILKKQLFVFSKADLGKANFENATIKFIDFRQTNLYKAKLKSADLIYSDLSNSNISEADLSNAHLYGAKLTDAVLTKANLTKADLTAANLVNAILDESILVEANLTNTDFHEAYLEKAKLIKANIWYTHFDNSKMQKAVFSDAFISGLRFQLTDLTEADFSRAKIAGRSVVIENCNLSRSKLSNIKLNGISVIDSNLNNADLSHSDLSNAVIHHSDLSGANLQETILINTNLAWSNLTGAKFKEAILKGANLRDVNLTNAIIDSEQLSEASDLTGAIMPNGEKYDPTMPFISSDTPKN